MASASLSREERYRMSGAEEGCSPVNKSSNKHKQCSGASPKAHRIECSELSATALSQIVAQAKSTANIARQMQPELIEELDRALANIDPTKVTSQLLKAIEHAPGLVAQLQQVLDRNSDSPTSILAHTVQHSGDGSNGSCSQGRHGLSPGDYLVLQTPILPATLLEDPTPKQPVHTSLGSPHKGLGFNSKPGLKSSPQLSGPRMSTQTHGAKVNGHANGSKANGQVSIGMNGSLGVRANGHASNGLRCSHASSPSAAVQPSSSLQEARVSTDSSQTGKSGSSVATLSDDSDSDSLWDASPAILIAEVQALRKHKDWADKKIDLLIRRVREAEGPQRVLKQEVRQLRLEKNSVEIKLKDFETSLQKLKDCTYTEATQRREFELKHKNTQAELRGAQLREQEVQNQLQEVQQTLRQERKKREAAERRVKKLLEEILELQVALESKDSELSDATKELGLAQSVVRDQKKELSDSQKAQLEAQQQILTAQQWGKDMEQLSSRTSATAAAREGELEGVISALNQQLDILSHQISHQMTPQPEASLYSHFNGPALFGGGSMQWLDSSPFTVHLNGMSGSNAQSSNLTSSHSTPSRGYQSLAPGDRQPQFPTGAQMEIE